MSDRVAELELHAAEPPQCRRMIESGHSGHLGGAMSAIDLITALYFDIMNVDPARPDWPERDRFLLSTGHKAMGQYGVLAERGYFDPALLQTYGAMMTALGGRSGHAQAARCRGQHWCAGSWPVDIGRCGARPAAAGTTARVFTVMGDGELPEGSNWEAAAAASSPQGRQSHRDRR